MDNNQDINQDTKKTDTTQQSVVIKTPTTANTENISNTLAQINANLEAISKSISGSSYNFNSSVPPFGSILHHISQQHPSNNETNPIVRRPFTLGTSQGTVTIPNDPMLVKRGEQDGQRLLSGFQIYAQLVMDQKKAFSEFRDALRQVAQNLMTIAKMRDTASRVLSMKQLADMHKGQIEDVAMVQFVSHQNGTNPVSSDNLYAQVQNLFNKRLNPESFKKDALGGLVTGNNKQFLDQVKDVNFKEFYIQLVENLNKVNQTTSGREGINAYFNNQPDVIAAMIRDDVRTAVAAEQNNIDNFKANEEAVGKVAGDDNHTQNTNFTSDVGSTAQSSGFLGGLFRKSAEFQENHPDAAATLKTMAAFGMALDNVRVFLLLLGNAALATAGTLMGLKALKGGSDGGGMGGGLGACCCCPCGPELQPQRVAQGAAGLASTLSASALAAALGGWVGTKPLPDHVTAKTTQPIKDYEIDRSYNASMGNYGVSYQPKVSKEDIGQFGADMHHAANRGMETFDGMDSKLYSYLTLLAGLAVILTSLPVSAPVAAGVMAAGFVGVGMTAGSNNAEAKGQKHNTQNNRGLLEYSPPENMKDLVKPQFTKDPYYNLNDSLDLKYQRPSGRNTPMTSNGMDIEWAKRNQTMTQTITNHQIFHMNFNGNILQDPPSLTKNVASAMGNKAVTSGGAVNIGTSGILV